MAVTRATAQQSIVRDALQAHDGFRSAQDVFADLRAAGHRIGLSTVYRHLQSFAAQGIADVIHDGDGEATYRYCGESHVGEHHHHLVCRHCGRAEEVEGGPVERWAAQTARRFGYVELDHTVELFGVCGNCRSYLPS
ncbi:transcriptional repressor [Nocardioides mangrovicus]|uniref:Transcriptional repressor n=1 Tax=Nocardioides mangrovicus TaxID=2478913 RepID=A0A3L8P5I2_9ACTN|nr:Fur family transcriptional regulator [Nocardioides mangrovicus]RLV49658.1 transcriptional repressor [Nocardioides mangrovicus]